MIVCPQCAAEIQPWSCSACGWAAPEREGFPILSEALDGAFSEELQEVDIDRAE